jgi:D-3-phosphoglycerate dehydrogenase
VHASAAANLENAGYRNVTSLGQALQGDELADAIADVHMLGIRSRTQLDAGAISRSRRLMAVGCFCIGTNQVDLGAATQAGVPVFNAPFSNTRSVAELVIGEIIMLLRGIFPKSAAAHRGEWIKSAAHSWEVRGKTLGIVGYGSIGSQLSVLAEALGMHVRYWDVTPRLPLGRAEAAASLPDLLGSCDVVSLHVPDLPSTRGMIGKVEIAAMRQDSFLVNASRGHVVDLEALATAIRSGRLLGAAVDVFPREPSGAGEELVSPLRGLPNVILTPHIGGSTAEAQARIGQEVARKLIDYSDIGTTQGAVNFAQVQLPARPTGTRFMHVHHNAPGVLARIDDVLVSRGLNIGAQFLQTHGDLGYVVIDIDGGADEAEEILAELRVVPGTVRARFLYAH